MSCVHLRIRPFVPQNRLVFRCIQLLTYYSLLSTTHYRAIRLGRVTVLLINNNAFCDTLVAVLRVRPTLFSLIWNKRPYGTFVCAMCVRSGVMLISAKHKISAQWVWSSQSLWAHAGAPENAPPHSSCA